ncbi:MAG: ligase-associated DNA damage response endonuclease PdeM [Lacibacter sp.]
MHKPAKLEWKNQTLWLSPESCLYWEQEQALIVSDIHFGKSGHFRKEGIGIPQTVFKEDLQRLISQVLFFKPKQLLVAGDFFHSRMNSELLLFEKWRRDLSALPIHLIKGNHDILENSWYKKNKIEVHEQQLQMNCFSFVHEMNNEILSAGETYFFTGHIHPGISISGLGKQSLRFPCFYFTETYAVLPAFGKFTGLYPVKPKKKDRVFAIVNKSIMEIN